MAITLKAGLTTAGAAFVVIAGIWSGWGELNSHWALQTEVLEMKRELQMRDNVNYLEGEKNILEYDIKRIASVLQMYQTRELINDGQLDPADRNRVLTLDKEMNDAEDSLAKNKEAIDAIRLSISD